MKTLIASLPWIVLVGCGSQTKETAPPGTSARDHATESAPLPVDSARARATPPTPPGAAPSSKACGAYSDDGKTCYPNVDAACKAMECPHGCSTDGRMPPTTYCNH